MILEAEDDITTAEGFRRRFPEIRTLVNWTRFAAEAWPVQRRVVTGAETLRECFTCFRYNLGGDINGYSLPFLPRLKLGTVLERIHRLRPRHRDRILAMTAMFQTAAPPLTLPAYDCGGGRFLLLDGNHRSCALVLSGVAFEMELHVLMGPRQASALPDVVRCR